MEDLFKILEKCSLCPRNCYINRYNANGLCGANNKLKIARADLHFYEEPVISGDTGSGTIFFSNCNLKCIFCQNKEISKDGFGKEISIERLSDICIELQNKKANNINLVTPTMYIPHIIEGIKLAKDKGLRIPVVYNTSGYEKKESIKLLTDTVDIYLTDFKYFDNELGKRYSNVDNYFENAKNALEEMYNQVGKFVIDDNYLMKKGIIVRILVLPEHILDAKNIIKYLYSTYKDNIIISIMNQYTPLYKLKYDNLNRCVSEQEYDEIVNYACDLGIKYAFIQEGETQKDSFIPNFDLSGV